jgi:hypothetical protein
MSGHNQDKKRLPPTAASDPVAAAETGEEARSEAEPRDREAM